MAKRNIIANIAAAKRIVCLGTAVFVAVAAARAATTVEIDGTTWTYTLSSGNATITAVAPADGTLIVPSEIDGHPVTTIRYNVGKGCENITSLVVADSVKTIGYGAFALCASLGEVVLGDGVTTIGSSTSANSNPTAGNYAFGGCAALTNVVFGSSLVTLNGSFCKCTALERVVLPESLVTIGADAFFGCERLISAEFGGNVATIGGYAFGGCQRLRYLRFHGDPPTVKNGAFNQMKSPAIVFREDDNGEWPETWRDYVVKPASEMTADADAPYDFAFHKVSKWPDSFFLTDGTNSFDACTKFFAGDPIYTAMAARDFWGDADLSHNVTNTLYVSGVSVTGRLVFLKTLMAGRPEGAIFPSLPLQNLAPGEYTATWVLNEPRSIRETNYANNSNSVSFVVVPATTVTFISEGKEVESRRYASGEPYGSFPTLEERAGFELSGWFTAEENGTRVTASSTVPASTTTLYAKWGPAPDADGVVRVEIDGTTWSYTLSNGDATIIAVAPASGSMVIPSEFYGHPVTGVRSSAFQGTSIESVVIPDSVVTMDQQAFENCPMLTNAVIGSGLAVVPARMFNNCGRLSAVTFKEGVEEIDEYAFYGTALKAVSLPSSMRKIGEGAFWGCEELISIVIQRRPSDNRDSCVSQLHCPRRRRFARHIDLDWGLCFFKMR